MNDEKKILNHMIDFYKKFCDGDEELNPIATGKEIKALEKILLYTEQLQSNWNSLREWLEKDLKIIYRDCGHRNNIMRTVLDKMNELEGKDK